MKETSPEEVEMSREEIRRALKEAMEQAAEKASKEMDEEFKDLLNPTNLESLLPKPFTKEEKEEMAELRRAIEKSTRRNIRIKKFRRIFQPWKWGKKNK